MADQARCSNEHDAYCPYPEQTSHPIEYKDQGECPPTNAPTQPEPSCLPHEYQRGPFLPEEELPLPIPSPDVDEYVPRNSIARSKRPSRIPSNAITSPWDLAMTAFAPAIPQRMPNFMSPLNAGFGPWELAGGHTMTVNHNHNHRDLNKPLWKEPPPPTPKCKCCGTDYYDGHDNDKPEKCYYHKICMREGDWIKHFQTQPHDCCPLKTCKMAQADLLNPEFVMQHWTSKHKDKCWFWKTNPSTGSVKWVQFDASMHLKDVVAGKILD